jgi:hypothetical protein
VSAAAAAALAWDSGGALKKSDHPLGIELPAIAVKGRLDEPALRPPEVSVTEDEALATDPLQLSEHDALPVVLVVLVEDVANVARMKDEAGSPDSEVRSR